MTEETKAKRTRRKAAPKIAISKGNPFPYEARVTTGLLNVREDPNRKARIIGVLAIGNIVTVADIVGEFARIEQGGYVRTDFIEKADD